MLFRSLIGKSPVYFDEKNQAMQVSATEIAVQVSFSWAFKQKKWPQAQDSGTGLAVDKDGMATIALAITFNQSSHIPQIRTQSITLGLGKLSVKLESHSGSVVSWFEDLFVNLIISLLKKTIEKAAATSLPPLLDKTLDGVLVVQPFQMEVMPGIGLDYSFPAKSVATANNIALPIAGEFYPYNSQPGTTPGEPNALPDATTTGEMIEIYVSEWTINALGRAAFLSGRLTTALTQDKVAPEQRKYFVSSYYADIAPGLIDQFGNDAEMAIVVNVEEEPNITVADDGYDVEALLRIALLGKKKDDPSFVKAFIVDTMLHLDGLVSTDGELIIGNMTAGEFSAKLVESAVGSVDLDGLKATLDTTIGIAVNYVNKVLATGIPLPSLRGLSVQKPIIRWSSSRYLLLSGDLQYIPPQ